MILIGERINGMFTDVKQAIADKNKQVIQDLAKSQTEENPIFYVQMAHARMSGIFRVAGIDPDSSTA